MDLGYIPKGKLIAPGNGACEGKRRNVGDEAWEGGLPAVLGGVGWRLVQSVHGSDWPDEIASQTFQVLPTSSSGPLNLIFLCIVILVLQVLEQT